MTLNHMAHPDTKMAAVILESIKHKGKFLSY